MAEKYYISVINPNSVKTDYKLFINVYTNYLLFSSGTKHSKYKVIEGNFLECLDFINKHKKITKVDGLTYKILPIT